MRSHTYTISTAVAVLAALSPLPARAQDASAAHATFARQLIAAARSDRPPSPPSSALSSPPPRVHA